MIISPTHKFIFFKPLKCAGSSVEYSLSRQCGDIDLVTGGTPEEEEAGFLAKNNEYVEGGEIFRRFHQHTHPAMLFERSAQETSTWDGFYKVTIVRNPWDLMVSGYWYMMSLNPDPIILITESDGAEEIKGKFAKWAHVPLSFESYWPDRSDHVSTPLRWFAQAAQSFIHCSIDRYLRFESIGRDYYRLCSDMSFVHYPLAKFKTTQRKQSHHYSQYYDTAMKKSVESEFADLIRKFGYAFESE
tara:strand:- start:734 stop:1465 length:732 start_codon:yes stop_codon:yes gene_type:complete